STGAIVLVKQAILSDSLNFWFLKTPLGFSKNFLKIIAKLLPVISGNFGGLISLVEKYTVDQANQYILEKLGENQIKMASGELSYVVQKTILNRTSLFKTNYIILYNPLTRDLIIEFYSHNPIEPPMGTSPNNLATKQETPNTNCWAWDRWYEGEKQGDNDGKIEPFIVRVEGKVNQDKDNFNWQNKNQVKVEVVFGQKVPTIDQSDFIERTEEEITTSFLKDKILNKIDPRLGDILDKALEVKEKVENTLNIASTVFQAIKTIFNLGSSSPSQALISSHLSTEAPENTSLKSQPAQLEPTSPAKEAGTTSQVVPKSTNVVVIDNQEYEVFPVIDPKQAENKPIEIKNEPQNNKETEKTTLPLKEKESQEKQNITFCQITEQVKSQAAKQNKVIFNEIAWMGSTNSVNDEWLELKNIQNNLVNLDGWQIINQKEKIKIALTGNLGAGSFLLLERTDDNSAPKEKADLIYTGAIANTDEGLFLFSPSCVLEDKILANPYFPAGDNYLKKT
ncbi:hypothetical protein FJ208_02795, partial [Candidatus Gribaldobacteria bacterium]|nr:hypothetical protein [Candidatus Gribaldobacteria bacterium]